MAGKDFYQSLGISKTASDTEIKAAYRKSAMQWHPDRNKSPEAIAKFKEVTTAYEILSDPKKRQTYDQFGSAAFEGNTGAGPNPGGNPFAGGFGGFQQGPFSYSYSSSGGGNPFGDTDPFEIFEQFFGGGFSSPGRRQRRAAYSINVTFMEAVHGVEKVVDINGKETKIKIPPGIDDGMRVRFSDFDLIVSVSPDKRFQREGSDIHISLEIDFATAILGTTADVPTVDGNVTIKIAPGTQPDTLIRLKDRGIPDPRGGSRGDQYVKIKVGIPAKISREQKQLLEKYQELSGKRSGWF